MHYNKKVGKFGERLARNFLERREYKVLEANYQASYKELDIIAEKGDFLVFIEVKTRCGYEFPGEEAVSRRKKKSLNYAIQRYIKEKRPRIKDARADLIVVDINKFKKIANIKHYQDIL